MITQPDCGDMTDRATSIEPVVFRSGSRPLQRLAHCVIALVLAVSATLAVAVVGGSGVDANTPASPWAGVGAVLAGQGHYSGALISPRHVLTAAHVVQGHALNEIAFRLNLDDGQPLVLPVAAVHVHPGYRGTQRGPDGFWRNDIAVLELARPAPPQVPVYALMTDPGVLGAQVLFVGYGLGGDGERGAHLPASPQVKRIGHNRIDVLLPHGPSDRRPSIFLFDFDGPEGRGNRFGPPIPAHLSLGPGMEANFASSDSGAPVFVYDRGAWRLLGVAAFVASTDGESGRYGSLGGGMLVSAYLDWLRSILPTTPAR